MFALKSAVIKPFNVLPTLKIIDLIQIAQKILNDYYSHGTIYLEA